MSDNDIYAVAVEANGFELPLLPTIKNQVHTGNTTNALSSGVYNANQHNNNNNTKFASTITTKSNVTVKESNATNNDASLYVVDKTAKQPQNRTEQTVDRPSNFLLTDQITKYKLDTENCSDTVQFKSKHSPAKSLQKVENYMNS